MVSESAAIADRNNASDVHVSWSHGETESAGPIYADLPACLDKASVCRRTVKRTGERWYDCGTRGSEASVRIGIPISDVVEEGHVEYVPVSAAALTLPVPGKIRAWPDKRKKIKTRAVPRSFAKI